jgi:hypothetical protein
MWGLGGLSGNVPLGQSITGFDPKRLACATAQAMRLLSQEAGVV